jgi:oligopeptide/dipeptide ABC transporter ATP-binding protein
MYAGRVVEQAGVHPTFEQPLHPYTEGLLGSIPSLDDERLRLQVIPGVVPSPFALPPGCRYAPRCPNAKSACDAADPPLIALQPDHHAACIRHTGYQVPAAAMAGVR